MGNGSIANTTVTTSNTQVKGKVTRKTIRYCASVALSALIAVLLGLSVGGTLVSDAQDAPPAVDGQDFVGTWQVAVDNQLGPTYPGLITFAAADIMIVSDPPIAPAPPDLPFTQIHHSGGLGVWASTGNGTVAFTFDQLVTDETGNLLGVLTIHGNAALSADGKGFEGTFDVVLTDPAGSTSPIDAGTITGTRMVIEAMETPSFATPAG